MKMRVLLTALLVLSAPLVCRDRAIGSTEDGSCLEAWELMNFQPQSDTHEQLVHSSSYHHRTTVVMFLAST